MPARGSAQCCWHEAEAPHLFRTDDGLRSGGCMHPESLKLINEFKRQFDVCSAHNAVEVYVRGSWGRACIQVARNLRKYGLRGCVSEPIHMCV